MFLILRKSGYTRHEAQYAQGYFLLLVQPEVQAWSDEVDEYGARKYIHFEELKKYPIRGLVRYVRMSQCGHWLMGILRHKEAKDGRITLSGAYGSDGLILTVPVALYKQGAVLPEDLYDAWNKGEGWNSAGNEAPSMREWGLTLLSDRQKRNINNWQRR